jgi:hypothetical protein
VISSFRHQEHGESKQSQTFVVNATRDKTLNSFSEALASKLANLHWTQRLQERGKLFCRPGLKQSLQVIARWVFALLSSVVFVKTF